MRTSLAAFTLGTLGVLGCGGAAPTVAAPTAAPAPAKAVVDDRSGFEGHDVGFVRSERLGLTLPLPDRSGWSIVDRDDASSGWLVATHAVTLTVVRVHRYEETSLVGRRECELRAILVGELPRAETRAAQGFETLSDEPLHRPKGWDAWRYVAFQPAAAGKLVGHVFLVAGRAHSCLVVHVHAEVHADAQADALADRLELFASKVVAAIVVDRAEEPGALRPEFPDLPPTPGVP
ncbi:MAG: hypothetical protein NVS3B10_01520 [Polyangiales bacterium]